MDNRPPGLEGVRDELVHGCTSLEELEQPHRRFGLLGARLEEPRRASDEHLGPLVRREVEQGGGDAREERALARRELRRLEPPAQRARAEPLADDTLVQVRGSPGHETGVGRRVEPEHPLRDAAGRGDDDDHEARRLQDEHLDVANRRRLQRRRRDQREQPRRPREHLRRRAERALDLVAHRAQVEPDRRRPSLQRLHELLRIQAVPALGGHASRGRVRVAEQAEGLELRELAAYRRRRHFEPGPLDERARPDWLPRGDVLLDDEAQDLPLAGRELHHRAMVAAGPADPACAGSKTRRQFAYAKRARLPSLLSSSTRSSNAPSAPASARMPDRSIRTADCSPIV